MFYTFLNKIARMFSKLRWYVFVVAAAVLILFVILMGMLRLALPYLTDYKAEVELQLQEDFGYPVRVEKIDADWYWFSPRLKLINVNVDNAAKKTQLIRFDQVIVEFDIKQSYEYAV